MHSIKNNKTWCPKCARDRQKRNSIEDCRNTAKRRKGLCLSQEYVNDSTKMMWQCKNNHIFSKDFAHIKHRDQWCPECANNFPLKLVDCQVTANERGGKCLSINYISTETSMEWECEKGHKWSATFDSIKNRKSWCPYCKNKTEQKVRKILEKLFNKEFPTVHIEEMRNPKTKRKLELDGYCEELNLAFEYDGEQHYMEKTYYGTDLKKRQHLDKLKDELCKKANIKLIRIPYWEKDNLEEYIEKEVKGL